MRIFLFLLFCAFACAGSALRTGVLLSEFPHAPQQLLIEKKLFTDLWETYNKNNDHNKDEKAPTKLSLQIFQVTEQRFQAIFKFDSRSKNGEKGLLLLPPDWIIAAVSEFPESENVTFQKNAQSLSIEFNQHLKGEILLIFELDDARKAQLNLPRQEKITVEFSSLLEKLQLQLNSGALSLMVIPGEKLHLSSVKSLQLQVLKQKEPERRPENTEEPDSPEPVKDFTTIPTEIVFTPVIQLVLNREQIDFLGHYQLNVLHQPLFELSHNFKQIDFSSISFEPPVPFRYTEDKLIFPEGLEGDKKLILKFSLPLKPETELPFPDFINLKSLSPELYIAAADSTELESFSAPDATEITMHNRQTLENLEIPIVKNYRMNRLPEKALLKTRSYPLATTGKLIKLSSKFDTIITDENKIAHSLELELLQNGAQDLNFKLPEKAQMFGSYINQKPVRSFFNEEGQHTIHLRPSADSPDSKPEKLKLEIRYLLEKQTEEIFHLQAPTGLEAMSTEWKLFFPVNRQLTTIKTNLQTDTTTNADGLWTNLQKLSRDLRYFQISLKTYSLIGLVPFTLILGLLFLTYVKKQFLTGASKTESTSPIKKIFSIGFIIVIAVILALIATPNFRYSRQRSSGRTCLANLKTISNALEMYELDHGRPLALNNRNTLAKLVKQGYLINIPECPEYPGQDVYRAHSGNKPYCIHHGDYGLFSENEDKSLIQPPPQSAPRSRNISRRKVLSRSAELSYEPEASIMELVQDSFMGTTERLITKEKKAYQKVQKSAVKPVRVMFPRLENEKFFHSNIPLEKNPFIEFQLSKTGNDNFTAPLISIISTLLFAIFTLLSLRKNNYMIYAGGSTLLLVIIMLQPQCSFIPVLSFCIFVFLAIYRKVGS
jgi:competence protein ComGC